MIEEYVKFFINRKEPNLDDVMREAQNVAMRTLGIDEDGHSKTCIQFDRSKHKVYVWFEKCIQSHGMAGSEWRYFFRTWYDDGGNYE